MKIRKIIVSLTLMAGLGNVMAQDLEPDMTGMEIEAREWTKSVRMGWNLGNALESAGATWDDATGTWKNHWVSDLNEWETGWGNPKTTREMIKAVKAAGFDAIRVPVRWVPHIIDYSNMTVDPVWMARVKEVVGWCLDEDMKVIINTHHDLWLESHPFYSEQAELKRKLKALWSNIASAFRDYDSRLAFAGTNEVTVNWQAPTEENLAVQNGYNQDFIDAVRATGGRNYYRQLIVQTYATDPTYGLAGFIIPEDKVEGRLSVEFHYYSPYSYCSGNESSYYYWGDAFRDKGNVCTDGNERTMRNLFVQLRKAWIEKGLGVVVGEYGVSHHYTDADRETQEANETYYLKCLTEEARKNGFAAFVWDNNAFGNGSEQFGIFNRKNNMSIDSQFFIDGIIEGSKAEFQEDVEEEEQEDVGAGGEVLWTGDKTLNWGDGIKIQASALGKYKDKVTVVLYYSPVATALYSDIQFCILPTWGKASFTIAGTSYIGDFDPRSYYGTSSASLITPFTFDGNNFSAVKNNGIVIQGFGVKVNKVVLIDQLTGVDSVVMDSPSSDHAVYSVSGIRIDGNANKGLYISNGRKFLHK